MAKTLVVKLGGSVLTEKAKPFSYRSDVASALAEEMASSNEKVIVVHGGGSYGHPVALQYGLNSNTGVSNATGVSQTRSAMFELNRLVCKTMADAKLNPYTFSPFDLVSRSKPGAAALWLRGLLKADLTPLTFGDVSLASDGFRIISGDSMCHTISSLVRPSRCVFAFDADGVYENDSRVIMPELSPSMCRKLRVSRGQDATGGMKTKLEMAAKIAALGTEVCLVSGYRRNEFSKALRGLDFYGTVVKP